MPDLFMQPLSWVFDIGAGQDLFSLFSVLLAAILQGKRENLPVQKVKSESHRPYIFTPNSLDIHTARTHDTKQFPGWAQPPNLWYFCSTVFFSCRGPETCHESMASNSERVSLLLGCWVCSQSLCSNLLYESNTWSEWSTYLAGIAWNSGSQKVSGQC